LVEARLRRGRHRAIMTVRAAEGPHAMTSSEAEAFAARWARAWNSRDIEDVLSHFHEDVEFTSPTAVRVVGTPTVNGKAALRDYWQQALTPLASLHFTVDRVLWDGIRRELAIIYTARIDGTARRVSENLRFDDANQVIGAEVFHGVTA
jgi:ketosteroid isomerase-like protein